jgi:hypothetical protein
MKSEWMVECTPKWVGSGYLPVTVAKVDFIGKKWGKKRAEKEMEHAKTMINSKTKLPLGVTHNCRIKKGNIYEVEITKTK